MEFFQNARFSLAQRTWPRALCYAWWNNCPFLRFVRLHFFQPNMVQLDQSCGEKTWRTRSSGWGYKMKASIWTHWNAFPLSNKAAYGFCPSNLMSVFWLFRGSFSLMILMVSLHLGKEVYVYYHPGIHTQHIFQCHPWIVFPLEMIQFYIASIQICSWMVAKKISRIFILHFCLMFRPSFFACISHPTFIGDLVPASLIVESCFKTSLSVGTTVTKSDTAAWYKNNNPTTRIFWTFQIEC